MKILLLGSTGLLGHNVARLLLEQGHEVHALVRNRGRLHSADFPHRETLLYLFEGSPADHKALRQAAEGCEAVINCAGCTDMSLLHYEDYLPANRDLCAILTELIQETGITRLVHVSTVNTIGYGTPEHPADEHAPLQEPFASSFYACSKQAGEELLLQFAAEHPEGHLIVVNPGFMIGAYDVRPSSGALLLAGWKKPLMAVPRGGKSFIPVRDAAAAIVNALTMGENGQRYLLTSENMTLKEFYSLQARCCGYRQCCIILPDLLVEAMGRFGDVLRFLGLRTKLSSCNLRQLMVCEYYDNRKARQELRMPVTPIDKAILDFFNYRTSEKKAREKR